MPVYEYECQKCSCQFELKQGFNDNPKVKCPECKGKAKRVFSPVPVIFKGSGFYVNDVKRAGEKKEKTPASGKPEPSKPSTKPTPTSTEGK